MDRIAVLIPCYNEGKTIADVVKGFRTFLPDAVVYVYDNNSTDGTGEIAAEAGAVVRRERQQGKGNVIRRMFREIDAECYIMADGDNTYPPESAPEMTRLVLEEDADMVVGDRLSSTYFSENKRAFHNFGNLLVRKLINFLFRNKIKDIMTGYRAFSYQFVKSFPVLSKGFEIETEMSIHAVDKNLAIRNVVIDYRDRTDGFGLMAIFLTALSLAFFIPVFADFLRTGEVDKFPTLIVCGFVMIAAIQAVFAGLILKNITQKNRQDFEMRLLEVRERKGEK